MFYISEFIHDNFAFISVTNDQDDKQYWKIDKESKEIPKFIAFYRLHKDCEFVTLKGCPVINCIVKMWDTVERLFKEGVNELDIVHQFSRSKNNNGIFADKQINITDLTGKDVTLKNLMSNTNTDKVGYFTEVELLKQVIPFYKDKLELRNKLHDEFGVDAYSTRYKLIHDIFKKMDVKNTWKKIDTDWKMSDILFKYEFKHKYLNEMLERLNSIKVTDNKISGIINEEVRVGSILLKMGTGGIHGCLNGEYETCDNNIVKYIDVSSYYPSIILNNHLVPNNLDNFEEVYRKFYDRKMEGNNEYKDLINNVWGLSNYSSSMFYDPKFMCSVSINGQLMSIELLESLVEVDTLMPILVNTDGFYYIVSRSNEEEAMMKINGWTTMYNLKIKEETVDKIVIKDGNNYFKIGPESKYNTDIRIDEKKIASYEGVGIFNPINFKDNPMKGIQQKEDAVKEMYNWLTKYDVWTN